MRHVQSPRTSRRLALRLVLAVGIALGIGAAPGGAVHAADSIAVDAGYGGFAQSGLPFPATIVVTADVLFEGELRVTGRSGGVFVSSRPVEIAGGTTREVTVIVDSGPWELPALRVELVADDGDRVVASADVRVKLPNTSELVGVFPSLAARGLPDSSSLTVDVGDAQLFDIDPDDLALGYGALAPLDIIAVSASDLRELDGAEQQVVMTWVNRGGRLLVDEPVGTRVAALPDAWQPSTALPHPAGLGEVVMTDGAAARGDWSSILEPSPTRSRYEDRQLADMSGFWGGEPLSWSLGRDSGFDLPGVGWMLALLGLYVLVAGPLTWFVLRSVGRPGLAWLVIPAISVVFTGALWLLGSSTRDGVDTVHGTIVEIGQSGSVASTFSLVNSRGGGDVAVTLPDGWRPLSSFDDGPTGLVRVEENAAGEQQVVARLDAGAFAVLGGSGPYPEADDGIDVVAVSTDAGRVSGTITNHLDVDLTEVAVFADQAATKVGDVPAGATVEFEVSSAPVDPQRGEPVEFQMWRAGLPPGWTGDFRNPWDPGAINLSLWSSWTNTGSSNLRQVGDVVVAGWTDQLVSPVDPEVTNGRSLVVARSSILVEDGRVTDVASARQIVRGPEDVGTDFRDFQMWGGGAMFAFTLPETAGRDDLVLSLPRGQRRAELLIDGEWRQVDIAAEQSGVFALPDAAVDERGRVYLKVLLSFEQGIKWRDLSVRTSQAGDDVAPLELVSAEAVG